MEARLAELWCRHKVNVIKIKVSPVCVCGCFNILCTFFERHRTEKEDKTCNISVIK